MNYNEPIKESTKCTVKAKLSSNHIEERLLVFNPKRTEEKYTHMSAHRGEHKVAV